MDEPHVGWQRPAIEESTVLGRDFLANDASALEGDADLCSGSHDYLTLWVNGDKVIQVRKSRSWGFAGDRTRVCLKKGMNHVLVGCDNLVGEWAISVRYTREDVKLSRRSEATQPGERAGRFEAQ